MPFHKHVLEVHAYLHGIEDDRAATMTALIHPGTHHNKNELIAMWKAVEKRSDTQDNLWVYVFLENVVRANSFPSFFYISQSERNALIKKTSRSLLSVNA